MHDVCNCSILSFYLHRISKLQINTLEKPTEENEKENTLHFPNRTNLHTHGLHVSSRVSFERKIVVEVQSVS